MSTDLEPGEVVRLEGVDIPPNARFYYVYRGDIRLRVMVAAPVNAPIRGTILFHPGRTEFIEKYIETIEDFLSRGFSVLFYDPRGQGLSSRVLDDSLKCYIESFDIYCDDFEYIVETFKADLPKPHIVMGHSMGGLIGLQTILSGRLSPAACAFTAPMLELQDLDVGLAFFVKLMSWAGFAKSKLPFQAQRTGNPVPFRDNKLTSDSHRYQLWATYFENHKRLRLGPPTYGWIAEAIKAMKFVNDNAQHLQIPGLIVASGADPIVTPASNADFAHAAGIDFVNVAGALHEVLLERDEYRDQFWAAFDVFLSKYGL